MTWLVIHTARTVKRGSKMNNCIVLVTVEYNAKRMVKKMWNEPGLVRVTRDKQTSVGNSLHFLFLLAGLTYSNDFFPFSLSLSLSLFLSFFRVIFFKR